MAKLPFMKFNPWDYVVATRALTDTEKAIWMDLLCFMWMKPDKRGFLRMDGDDLSRLLGRDGETVIRTIISLKNKKIADIKMVGDGPVAEWLIVSRRMMREAKSLEMHAKRQKRYNVSRKSNDAVDDALNDAKTDASMTDKKIEDRRQKIEDRKKKEISPGFDEFYQAYPRKVGRHAAQQAWARIKPTWDLKSRIIASVQAWAKTDQWQDPQYIPHPSTYLNQRRWEDEIPTRKDASYEALKAKAREDDERIKRILAGNGGRNGVGKIIRPAGPKSVEGEESDLDTGIDFDALADEGDPPGHSIDQGG